MRFRTTVPPNGTRPGQLLRVTVYDGTYGYITLPPGLKPGDDLDFEMELDDEEGMRELARRKGLFVPLVPKRNGKDERLTGTGTGTGTKRQCCGRWHCPNGFVDMICSKFDPSKTPLAAVLLRLALLPITSYCIGTTLMDGPFALIDVDSVANPTYLDVLAVMADARVASIFAARVLGAVTFVLCLCELFEGVLRRIWRGLKQGGVKAKDGEEGNRKRDAEKSKIPVAMCVQKGGTGTVIPPKLPRVSSLSDHLPPEVLGLVSCYLDVHDVNVFALCSVRAGVGAANREYDVVGIIRRSYLRRNFRYLSFLWRREYEVKYKGVREWMDANPDWKRMYTRPYCKAFRWDYTDYTLPDSGETDYTLSDNGEEDANDDGDEDANRTGGNRLCSSSPFFSPTRRLTDGRLIDYDRFTFDCIFDDIRGAVSFGLTDVLRYLVEERGADVNALYPHYISNGGYDNGSGDGDEDDEEDEDEDEDGQVDGDGGEVEDEDGGGDSGNVWRRRPSLYYALIDSREAPVPSSSLGELNDQSQSQQVSPLEYLLSLPSLDVNWSWTNDESGQYWNLFQFAACSGQVSPSNFSLLLNHPNINVNAQPSPCRRSALHDACLHLENAGSAEKVGLLLKAGADPNIVDGRGCTPWKRMSDWWDDHKGGNDDISEKDSKTCKEIAALLRDAGGIDPKGGELDEFLYPQLKSNDTW